MLNDEKKNEVLIIYQLISFYFIKNILKMGNFIKLICILY